MNDCKRKKKTKEIRRQKEDHMMFHLIKLSDEHERMVAYVNTKHAFQLRMSRFHKQITCFLNKTKTIALPIPPNYTLGFVFRLCTVHT